MWKPLSLTRIGAVRASFLLLREKVGRGRDGEAGHEEVGNRRWRHMSCHGR